MVRLLLSAGAKHDIQAANTNNMKPLHWAAGWGNIRVVEELLTAGADINAKTSAGDTPIEIAKEHGNDKIVQYFRGILSDPCA